MCPSCRVTASVDPTRQAAACSACHARLAPELAIDLATGARPYQSHEVRWVLVPLLGAFAAALGLLAVSQLAAFLVWLAGSAVTLAIGAWHARLFGRTTPTADRGAAERGHPAAAREVASVAAPIEVSPGLASAHAGRPTSEDRSRSAAGLRRIAPFR